jgi:outer membrane protein TolC
MDDPLNTYTGGLGLALRWDMDFGRRLGELAESRAELAKLQSEAAEAERGVRLEVEKLAREALDARTMVDVQHEAMTAARGWVIAKTDLYENGLAEINDVLTGLVAFFQARMDHLKAIYDYDVAVANLERATGLALMPDFTAGDGRP